MNIRNIEQEPLTISKSPRGDTWRRIDLSGEHLGVRIEELRSGEHSSVHHYHTTEEEHLLVLDGTATLVLDDAEHALSAGDHVCFLAGTGQAHHVENRGEGVFRYLVFGERHAGDVVFYPKDSVLLVKSPDVTRYRYAPHSDDERSQI